MNLKEFELSLRMMGWEIIPANVRRGSWIHKYTYSFGEYVNITRLKDKNQLSLVWRADYEDKPNEWHRLNTREFHTMMDYLHIAHSYSWVLSSKDVKAKALENEG